MIQHILRIYCDGAGCSASSILTQSSFKLHFDSRDLVLPYGWISDGSNLDYCPIHAHWAIKEKK